ncbi:MAG: hypothetical protein BIFFINMI_03912 [Phycisphaerae bacterium]|nr:hypothetical protein [Phycisphaerae bacterium]
MKFALSAQGLAPFLLVCAAALAVFYFYLYRREARQAHHLTFGQQIGLWALRALVALMVLVALAKPTITQTVTTERTPVVALLVDDSDSMSFPASTRDPLLADSTAARRTRFDSSRQAVRMLTTELAKNHNVQVFHFSAAPERVKSVPQYEGTAVPDELKGDLLEAIKPHGDYSNIGDGIIGTLDRLTGDKVSGVVVLTDGRQTGGAGLAAAARAAGERGVRVDAVVLGSPHELSDLRINPPINVPSDASLGDVLTFHVSVTNEVDDRLATTVDLYEKNADKPDEPFEKIPEATRELKGADELTRGERDIEIPMIPLIEGNRRFRIVVHGDKRELDWADYEALAGKDKGNGMLLPTLDRACNNVAEVTIRVIKRTLRVLLICGEPSREYLYMVPALMRDPIVQMSTWLQAADIDYTQQGNENIERLPSTLDEWSLYDVCILMDVDPNGLTVQQMGGLEHMVAKGGGLMIVAGRNQGLAKLIQVHSNPVRGLLPVEVDKNVHPDLDMHFEKPFKAERTPEGARHPLMAISTYEPTNDAVWATFPELYWHHPVLRKKPKAIVLMKKEGEDDGRGDILMAIQRYGEGAVFFSAIDSLWLWRYPHESYDYDRFWTRAIRHLGEARLTGTQQQVSIGTDRVSYPPGEDVGITLRILDPALWQQLQDQVIYVTVTGPSEDYKVRMTRDASGAQNFRGKYRTRRLGKMEIRSRQSAPDADSEAKPLFDVKTEFTVAMQSLERLKTSAYPNAMADLVQPAGGEIYFAERPVLAKGEKEFPYKDMAELSKLPSLIPADPQKVPREFTTHLWDGWTFLTLFLVLAAAEWSLRKWWGLL